MKSKKHKVEIPEGYEFRAQYEDKIPGAINIISEFKPIKKQLPKTWEEYKNNDRDILETMPWEIVMPIKYTKAFHALIRLVQLRDHYNDGCVLDWTNNHSKYIIYIEGNCISEGGTTHESEVLAFKTPRLRDKFLSNFRELIETAKPLL